MDDPEARRHAELTAYLARSRAVQGKLRWLLAVGVVVTIALWLGDARAPIVPLVAMVTAVTAGSGFWITHGHIADFRGQLETLEAARRRRRH